MSGTNERGDVGGGFIGMGPLNSKAQKRTGDKDKAGGKTRAGKHTQERTHATKNTPESTAEVTDEDEWGWWAVGWRSWSGG